MLCKGDDVEGAVPDFSGGRMLTVLRFQKTSAFCPSRAIIWRAPMSSLSALPTSAAYSSQRCFREQLTALILHAAVSPIAERESSARSRLKASEMGTLPCALEAPSGQILGGYSDFHKVACLGLQAWGMLG